MRPGLYVATVRGVEGVHVLFYESGLGQTASLVEGCYSHGDDNITDARPLVVLDPESDEDVERLYEAWSHVDADNLRAEFRGALRALAAPKPPEPTGLGAVVRLRDGRTAVRAHATSEHPWVISDEPGLWSWRGLVEKVGLSEGWSA